MTTSLAVERVELAPDGVSIEWKDGHKSLFESKYLRLNCGCAECVEEWTNRKLLDPAAIPVDIHAEDYLMVGRYAVQFLWSDLHVTGIYPFELLRRLCRCDECRTRAEGEADPAQG